MSDPNLLNNRLIEPLSPNPEVISNLGKGYDALTQLIQGMFSSVADATAQQTTNALQDQMDVGALLPDKQSEVVKQLALDQAAAYSTVADLNAVTAAPPLDLTTGKPATSPPIGSNVINPNFVSGIQTTINQDSAAETKAGRVKGWSSDGSSNVSEMSPRAQQLYDSFKGAFPDKNFKVTEANGQITLTDLPASAAPIPVTTIPSGHDAKTGQKGLEDIQKSLLTEPDPTKQLQGAYDLMRAVSVQSAAKYQQYVNQAESQTGVPDLVQAVANSRALDARDPQGRGMSMQTDAAIRELRSARQEVNAKVSWLMKNDPVIQPAADLAAATISRLKDTAALEGKSDTAWLKGEMMAQKQAAVAAEMANPDKLQRLSIIRNGAQGVFAETPEGKALMTAFGTGIATKQIPVHEIDQAIATMPKEDLAKYYTTQNDPTVKSKIRNVIIYEEANAMRGKTGGVPEGKMASQGMNLFDSLMKQVRDNPNDPRIPEVARQEFKKKQTEIRMIPDKTEKRVQEEQSYRNLGSALVTAEVQKTHSADIRSWGGLVQSDATAKAVIAQADEKAAGKPIPIKEFISAYMNYSDGKKKPDKITELRKLVVSSVDAIPNSVIFPKPSTLEYTSAVDKQVASQMLGILGQQHGFIPMFSTGMLQGAAALSSKLTE